MNDIQCLIDRQLGIYCRLNYDNILKRLVVNSDESFYGLQSSAVAEFDQDPPIFACRFSEAPGYEHILALANEDGRVAIQDTSTIKSASNVEGFQCHNNAVFDLAWRPGYMNFVTVSGDHTACLWDVAEGAPKRVQVFAHHTRSVKTAVFRPHEPTVFATGARDGHVLVWDVRARSPPAVVLRPDSCLLGCHAGAAASPAHGKRPRPAARRAVSITGLVFRDDVTLVSCGECDGSIKLWDLRKSYSVYTREPLPMHSIPYCGGSTRNGYTNLIMDEARVRLYASCMDNVIYCFNVAAPAAPPERRLAGHENGTFYIKTGLSPDGRYLVSGSSDKHAYVWNVECSQPVVRLAGHRAEVTCAAWCQRGDLKLVTCSDDARHKIWRVGRELPDADALSGRAEPAPPAAAPPPHWGALDRTPGSLKRRAPAPAPAPAPAHAHHSRAKRPAAPARNTKRCLTDLMNASRESDDAATKRIKLDVVNETDEPEAAAAGRKRPAGAEEADGASPAKKCMFEDLASSVSADWDCSPKPGASFMTPTKNYERKNCKKLSPKSPKPISPNDRSPKKGTPPNVRIISFGTPTKNLPNFVLDGEAPHQRLMSPAKKKRDTTDWLTRLARARAADAPAPAPAAPAAPAPHSPRAATATAAAATAADKTPKSTKNNRTLLKYFHVKGKDK